MLKCSLINTPAPPAPPAFPAPLTSPLPTTTTTNSQMLEFLGCLKVHELKYILKYYTTNVLNLKLSVVLVGYILSLLSK